MSLRSRLQQIPVFWTKREVLGASEPVQVLFARVTAAVLICGVYAAAGLGWPALPPAQVIVHCRLHMWACCLCR